MSDNDVVENRVGVNMKASGIPEAFCMCRNIILQPPVPKWDYINKINTPINNSITITTDSIITFG